MISIQAVNKQEIESNESINSIITDYTNELKKEINPTYDKNNDIWISPYLGEDKYPSITVDGKGNTVIIWTNEESDTTSYMGLSYTTDRFDENEWQNNAVIAGLATDNPIKFDIGYMNGKQFSGLAGCYYEKTDELQGGFNIEDVTDFISTFDFWTWNSDAASNMIVCETVDQVLTSGVHYPQYTGWWDMLIYDFNDMGYNISQCPVLFRTDALMAGGVSFFDAQSHQKTAPADFADFYVKDINNMHMVINNIDNDTIIWKMLKLDEESDIEYTPYQATIGNGSQTQIAGNKDTVVITYVENNTVKSLYSNDDGTSWQTSTIAEGYYPNICEVYGFFFTAFINNNNLYLSVSNDGGATWSSPEQVNTNNGSVVNESQSMDIHKGGIVWTDNRGSDLDIYYQPLYQVFNVDTNEYFYAIQEAIDDQDTLNGHTIRVSPGSYYEYVDVNKTINLKGDNKDNTIIGYTTSSNNKAIVLDEGFENGFPPEDWTNDGWQDSLYGTAHSGTHWAYSWTVNSTLATPSVRLSFGPELRFWYAAESSAHPMDLEIYCNDDLIFSDYGYTHTTYQEEIIDLSYYQGINVVITFVGKTDGYYGQLLDDITIENDGDYEIKDLLEITADGASISNFTIANSGMWNNGMYIESNNNSIYNNNIMNHYYGIRMVNSANNLIYNNWIEKNNGKGIHLNNNALNNLIYNNRIINNSITDNGNTIWNISKTPGTNILGGPYLGGNYWSDYTGEDTDDDGIGDTMLPHGPGDQLPLTILLDINQSTHDRGFPIRHAADGDWGAAQNFIPNYDILSYTQIYIRKFGSPEFNLTVELRSYEINGPVLDTLTFSPSEIPTSWTWHTIDFNDVTITPGFEYFIKCPPAPSGVTTSFGYEWGYAFGNQYDDGAFWFTRDGGNLWRDLPTMYEFVFKTYGYN